MKYIAGLVFVLLLALSSSLFSADTQVINEDNYPTPNFDKMKTMQIELSSLYRLPNEEQKAAQEKINTLNNELHKVRILGYKESGELNNFIFDRRKEELRSKALGATYPNIPKFGILDYPLIDGSTSTHPLGVLIACKTLEVGYVYGRPNSAYNWAANYQDEYQGNIQYDIFASTTPREQGRIGLIINNELTKFTGTDKAYTNLFNKNTDIILVARKPSPEEKGRAAALGVLLDIQPVALDAFVFVNSRENSVSKITTDQVKGVYSGKITNWKEFGGKDVAINPYGRQANSGSEEMFLELVMKDTPVIKLRTPVLMEMGAVFSRLAEDTYGLSYSVYYYEHFMAASPQTKTMKIDGVRPTFDTIRSRKYPYTAEVYVVIRNDEPADSGARKLRDWLLTDEGQGLVAESGYVPIK